MPSNNAKAKKNKVKKMFEINYSVDGNTFSFSYDMTEMSTPKSVMIAAEKHYAKSVLQLSENYYDERGYYRESPELPNGLPALTIDVTDKLLSSIRSSDSYLKTVSDEKLKSWFI